MTHYELTQLATRDERRAHAHRGIHRPSRLCRSHQLPDRRSSAGIRGGDLAMDTKANLKEQLELAREIIRLDDNEQLADFTDTARLAELVLALDEWMRDGGFSPWK